MKSVILGTILLGCMGSSWAQTAPATVSAAGDSGTGLVKAAPQAAPQMEGSSPSADSQSVEQTSSTQAAPSAKVVPYKVMTDFKDPAINTAWAEGQKALEEHRWFKPAGNNAAEYYLQAHQALSQKNGNPAYVEATQEALRSLFPYVLMSAEAALERNDKEEANRLISLLGKMDPNAPAVQRLNLMVNAVPPQEIR